MNGSVVRGFLVFSTVLITGCPTIYRGPVSPYMPRYQAISSPAPQAPDLTAIQSAGTFWTIDRPPDDVWQACLETLSQYEGILTLRENGAGKTALVIHGQEMQLKGQSANAGMNFSKFLDVWLAVNVIPEADGKGTTVSVAWISPQTGEAVPLGDTSAVLHPQESAIASAADHRHLSQPTGFEELSTNLAVARVKAQQQIAASKEPEDRRAVLPSTLINDFYYQLAVELFGAERWVSKFGLRNMTARAPGSRAAVKPEKGFEKYASFELESGNWASARLRRMFVVLDRPQVTTPLRELATRLMNVAAAQTRRVEVHLLASPDVNAFALPNGDIFIFTGLLENLATVDEIAAVVAHEIDHVVNHDTTSRLVKMKNTQNGVMVVTVIVAAASAGAGAALAPAAGAGASMASSGSAQLTQNLITQGIQLAGNATGQLVGNTVVSGHSEKIELRADANGAEYVAAAGYDVNSEVQLLDRLEELRIEASERNELISTALINAEPGLAKRRAAMQKTLSRISTPPESKGK